MNVAILKSILIQEFVNNVQFRGAKNVYKMASVNHALYHWFQIIQVNNVFSVKLINADIVQILTNVACVSINFPQ